MTIDLSKIEAQPYDMLSSSDDEIAQSSHEEAIDIIESPEEPTEAADEVDEQTMIRKRLILKMYLNEFPDKLKSYSSLKNKIDGMDLDTITRTRKEFEISIGMKNSIAGLTNSMMSGISLMETALNKLTPINATGLTQVCNSDPEFLDDLKLVALKYAEKINVKPEVRVGFTITKNILLLDRVNKSRADEPYVAQPTNPTEPTNPTDNMPAVDSQFLDL